MFAHRKIAVHFQFSSHIEPARRVILSLKLRMSLLFSWIFKNLRYWLIVQYVKVSSHSFSHRLLNIHLQSPFVSEAEEVIKIGLMCFFIEVLIV